MLFSVSAMPKPSARLFRSSMTSPCSGPADLVLLESFYVGAQRDRELQAGHEHQRAEHHQRHREDQHGPQPEVVAAEARAHDEDDAGEQHADNLEQHAEDHHGDEDEEDRAPMELVDVAVLRRRAAHAADRDDHTEDEEDD